MRCPALASRGMLGPCQEVEDDVAFGVMADHRPVRRREAADKRQQCGCSGMALDRREGLEAGDRRSERLGPAVVRDELLGGSDDLERSSLALFGRVAPSGDSVSAENRADRRGVIPPDRRHVETELEAWAPPFNPGDTVAKAAAGQPFSIGCRREGDPRVRMKVVDVVGVDESVHRRVDRRRGAAATVQAVVEGPDHLVLAVHARVDVHERAQPIEPQDGQTRLGQGAQVSAGALDPQQLDRHPRRRIDPGPLRRRVPTRVVRIPRDPTRAGSSAPGAPRRADWHVG